MLIKGIIWEDFVNYKEISTTIMFPFCDWKCGKELCQNHPLNKEPNIEISNEEIIEQYLKNKISKALVFQGLEPLDSFSDVYNFIKDLREKWKCEDDIVIYTGYTEDEVQDYILLLKKFKNIIVKFGRYIPNEKSHEDPILKVKLASSNQYAKKIS